MSPFVFVQEGQTQRKSLSEMCSDCFQDSGGFLCVIDDSTEHMLSVWDCAKETKVAEIKVKTAVENKSSQLKSC